MKTIAVLLTALLAASLHAVAADSNTDACVAECRTQLLQQSEKDCAYWRGELPRPDLYNHCQHGHTEGREASCTMLCTAGVGTHHDRRLDSQRLDACAEFRGRPPSERVSACNEGFVQARARAVDVAAAQKLQRANEPATPNEPAVPVVNKPDSQDAKRDDAETKRKLTVNSASSPKSLLEAAREEAAAAFQDAKATEL